MDVNEKAQLISELIGRLETETFFGFNLRMSLNEYSRLNPDFLSDLDAFLNYCNLKRHGVPRETLLGKGHDNA